MCAITQLCYSSPITGFFQWVSKNAPCSGPATEVFRRTVVQKLDAQDQPKVYEAKDPVTKQVIRRFTDVRYLEEIETGDLYYNEPRHVIAGKCVDIVLATPFYLVTTEIFNVVRTTLLVFTQAMNMLYQVGEQACRGDLAGMGTAAWNGTYEIGFTLAEGVWDIVSAPFYAIGMEFSALYGIVDQYRGRKWVAAIEHSWQKGVSYREDKQKSCPPPDPTEPFLSSSIRDLKGARLPYLANCFQVRGNVNDPKIRVVRSDPW